MLLYPWLHTIYNQIMYSYFVNKGHHALLFHSARNQGEDVLINFISRWLICSNPHQMKYCGICENCYLMHKEQHPDYYQIDAQPDIKSIGVDAIRMLINSIQHSTQYGKSKVVFIKHVEYLTNQAMCVLLKTLEEPPSNTYFFLKTRQYMKIPITLLSRCMKWSITAPSESLGLSWLMKESKMVDIISAKTALRLCQKSPIEANFILQSSCWKKRLKLYAITERIILTNGNFLKLLPYFDIYKCNNMFLYWFITLLIDALKMQQKVKEQFIVNLDNLKLISIISKHWDVLLLNDQVKQWLILFRYFKKFDNINRELLLTYRLLNWNQGFIELYF